VFLLCILFSRFTFDTDSTLQFRYAIDLSASINSLGPQSYAQPKWRYCLHCIHSLQHFRQFTCSIFLQRIWCMLSISKSLVNIPSQPPINLPPMNSIGTVRWPPLILASSSWISDSFAIDHKQLSKVGFHTRLRSISSTVNFAPNRANTSFSFLQ